MKSCDVVVVGAGFLGVQTALRLSQNGFSVTLFSSDEIPLSSCFESLGVLWPGLNDPPTRSHVAHGPEVATYLNDFCAKGVESFLSAFPQLEKQNNLWFKAPCYRVAMQKFEQEELQKAQELGFDLKSTATKEIFEEKHSSLIMADFPSFQEKVVSALLENNVTIFHEKVLSIDESTSGCVVQSEHEQTKCEVAVLANGLQIKTLLPKYNSILIPMSDICFEYQCKTYKKFDPITFRAANGHVAVSFFQDENKLTTLKISGPRFLLPQAGAGVILDKDDLNPRLLNNIHKYTEQIFTMVSLVLGYRNPDLFFIDFPLTKKNMFLGLDCYPCDELPLVGEFGKLGRILGCTGFLATSFSAGSLGAKILTDMICHQKSDDLHPRLQPRRFIQLR